MSRDKKEYFKKYYETHKQHEKERKAKWYQDNIERVREKHRQYAKEYVKDEANLEKKRKHNRESYWRNREKRLAYAREYRKRKKGVQDNG